MPKAKTHKGLAKRVKITAGGKVKFRRPGNSHLASHKPGYRVRKLRKKGILSKSFSDNVVKLLSPGR